MSDSRKTILIIGANRGIGLELARQYAAERWRVIATARDPGKADELAGIDGVEVLPLEVTDPDSLDSFVDRIGDRPIDVLLHNAGVFGGREIDRQKWLHTLEVNCIAPSIIASRLKGNVARSSLKKMAVMSSVAGSIAENKSGGMPIYRSSKAALNAAWKSLSLDFSNDGIALVMLHPGWVKTDMGGENANIDAVTAVRGLRRVIDDLSLETTGRLLAYDGREIAW